MFDYKKHFLHAPDEALPTPVTTKEQYLYAKVTGGDTSNLPTPVTTEEQYLYAMAQSGDDSGDGGGVYVIDADKLTPIGGDISHCTYSDFDRLWSAIMGGASIVFQSDSLNWMVPISWECVISHGSLVILSFVAPGESGAEFFNLHISPEA